MLNATRCPLPPAVSSSAVTAPAPPPHDVAASVPLPLVRVDNAAGSVSAQLIARIAPDDHQLGRLMAQLRSDATAADTQRAAQLIDALHGPRRQLAERTADALVHWLRPDGTPRFDLKPQELQQRVLHAGLEGILRHLPLGTLSSPQRLTIATALRDVGAHPSTLRAWMGLDDGALRGDSATVLLDHMLSHDLAATLSRNTRSRRQLDTLRQERADAWQDAARINRRFGYTTRYPAWDYMAARKQADPRIRQLRSLANSLEGQRKGVNVQLP